MVPEMRTFRDHVMDLLNDTEAKGVGDGERRGTVPILEIYQDLIPDVVLRKLGPQRVILRP